MRPTRGDSRRGGNLIQCINASNYMFVGRGRLRPAQGAAGLRCQRTGRTQGHSRGRCRAAPGDRVHLGTRTLQHRSSNQGTLRSKQATQTSLTRSRITRGGGTRVRVATYTFAQGRHQRPLLSARTCFASRTASNTESTDRAYSDEPVCFPFSSIGAGRGTRSAPRPRE
jgi:hypothetical protein